MNGARKSRIGTSLSLLLSLSLLERGRAEGSLGANEDNGDIDNGEGLNYSTLLMIWQEKNIIHEIDLLESEKTISKHSWIPKLLSLFLIDLFCV